MRDRIVRRGILPIAAIAALFAVGACGFSGGGDSHKGSAVPSGGRAGRVEPRSVTALRAVEKATAGAGSARIESVTDMGGMLSLKTDGALGWSRAPVGTLRITYTGGRLAETMRKLNSTSMEARLLPDAYYAKVGATFARRLHGRHWIRYVYDDLAALPGGSGAQLSDQLRNTAPLQPVRLLLASGDVRRVGEETVRGRHATHYSGTVMTAALTGEDVAGLKEQLEQAGVTAETVDIWVDDHNLLIKKTERGELSSGRMSSTAYYRDYGVQVPATEPPAADTADFKELMSTQGS
ncbi:hypothetical protein ACFOZ0_26815 [Streptomyces yaanensis]|uniref:Lipoprotein n=1 Tax=Streptomyces yaanensis TaxID=1142239 RepID=A0ABV7SIQ7_9ACTN|nr:hypothetical protein [Streptomyces sp. CGMCC 4.7035]WNB97156.1 hypothetical protein Q2K21_03200 [Streptomyces sp. CGMCC 4.7035]